MAITKNIQELIDNPALLKKYSKQDIGIFFEELIKDGNVNNIDYFLNLPFPKNKEIGVHVWNAKSNAFSFYSSYATLALTHHHTAVFEYFQQQRQFESDSVFYRLCAEDNVAMIDYLLDKFPPKDIKTKDNLLIAAMNDNYLEQFRSLTTHKTQSIDIYIFDYEILKHACIKQQEDFIAILMIDCNMQLNKNIKEWLNGDNHNEVVYPLPEKLVVLRELNEKLKTAPKKQHCIFGRESQKNKI